MELLEKYFSIEEKKNIINRLKIEKQRTTYVNDKYFVKVGKNTDSLFFNNMIKEVALYKDNINNENLPKLIDYEINDDICIIILERIYADNLGNHRNEFNLNITENERITIAEDVLKIANMTLTFSIKDTYNKVEKFEKYFNRDKKFLNEDIVSKLNKYKDEITEENEESVLSHGDLICTNIMQNDSKIYFIDWEFFSLRPKYYDLAYFLLFSKEHDSLDILKRLTPRINIESVYKEAILICLKEISNNSKLYGKVEKEEVDKNINRWIHELEIILRKFDIINNKIYL